MSDAKTQEARLSETGPFFARKPRYLSVLKRGAPAGWVPQISWRATYLSSFARASTRAVSAAAKAREEWTTTRGLLSQEFLLLWQRAPVRLVWAQALVDLFMAWARFKSQMVRLMRTIYTSPGLVFKANAMH